MRLVFIPTEPEGTYINPFSAKPYIIIITRIVPSLSAVAEKRKKKVFFWNRSSDETVYAIELNFFFFFVKD